MSKLSIICLLVVLLTGCAPNRQLDTHFSQRLPYTDPCAVELPSIELSQPFDVEGVIVPDSVQLIIGLPNATERYTPSRTDVAVAEAVLYEQFNEVWANDSRAPDFEPVRDVHGYFESYRRQYYGFIDEQGNAVVGIILLNFGNRAARREFRDMYWRCDAVVGSGEFFERNQRHFQVDVDARQFIVP